METSKEGECRICGVELISGTRCIDCFTAKISSRGYPFNELKDDNPFGLATTTAGGSSTININDSATVTNTQTITSRDIQRTDGTIERVFRTTAPDWAG